MLTSNARIVKMLANAGADKELRSKVSAHQNMAIFQCVLVEALTSPACATVLLDRTVTRHYYMQPRKITTTP
jgi:hypothetical protein